MTDPHRLHPDHAPTPFTADEIRAGCQPPRTIRVQVERAGAEPHIRVTRFLEADAEGARQQTERFGLTGAPLDAPDARRVTWLGFQSHASYPLAQTEIGEETIELPAGRYDCWRYTVRDDDSKRVFWFAKELPGMPVRVEEREGDNLTYRMFMLENRPGATLAG